MFDSGFARSLFAGLAGFVGYGAWAWYANLGHGDDVAVRSGLVQGGYSLVLTFVMTLVTELIYARCREVPGAHIVSTGSISVVLFVSAYSIHMLVGTPEILMTILPGWVIGTIYTFFYIMGLKRLSPD
ncbi:MAG: hypothetical protein AAF541_07305 [Pseudomonadota bacterium]